MAAQKSSRSSFPPSTRTRSYARRSALCSRRGAELISSSSMTDRATRRQQSCGRMFWKTRRVRVFKKKTAASRSRSISVCVQTICRHRHRLSMPTPIFEPDAIEKLVRHFANAEVRGSGGARRRRQRGFADGPLPVARVPLEPKPRSTGFRTLQRDRRGSRRHRRLAASRARGSTAASARYAWPRTPTSRSPSSARVEGLTSMPQAQ